MNELGGQVRRSHLQRIKRADGVFIPPSSWGEEKSTVLSRERGDSPANWLNAEALESENVYEREKEGS